MARASTKLASQNSSLSSTDSLVIRSVTEVKKSVYLGEVLALKPRVSTKRKGKSLFARSFVPN